MPEIKVLQKIDSLPGVKRDGTQLDGDYYSDSQWCRWYRGRPRKMGGYRRLTSLVPGPVRKVVTWAISGFTAALAFGPLGIKQLNISKNLVGGALIDRTPSPQSFTPVDLADNLTWVSGISDGVTWTLLPNGSTTINTSTDGVNWDSHALAIVSADWRNSIYHDSGTSAKGIAVAYNDNKSSYSDDSVTWVAGGALPSVANWTAIASYVYNSNQFCLVFGYNSTKMAYTADYGVSWTAVTLPQTDLWRCSVGMTSYPGWTYLFGPNYILCCPLIPSVGAWFSYAFANNVYCACRIPSSIQSNYLLLGLNSDASVVYKIGIINGNAFSISSQATGISVAGTAGPYSLQWDGNQFVYCPDGASTEIAVSPDGAFWEVISTPASSLKLAVINPTTKETLLVYGGTSDKAALSSGGFTPNSDYLWSTALTYDAAAGSDASLLLALPTKTALDISDRTEYTLQYGYSNNTDQFFLALDDNAKASGCVFVAHPYSILCGNDGLVTWSNANEPLNYTTGDAGSNRVAGTKLVAGKSIRSGSGPAGLIWSQNSLVRMDYIGGDAIFKFQTLDANISIIAQNSPVEHDGMFYWIGVDRFYITDGSVVNELPNQMNLAWFYENLNRLYTNKIWGTKIPQWGEIWWHFPKGDSTECNHAIIFNVREKCWYDTPSERSAGQWPKELGVPVWSNMETTKYFLTLTWAGAPDGVYTVHSSGDSVSLVTSRALGTVLQSQPNGVAVEIENSRIPQVGETLLLGVSGLDYLYEAGTVTAITPLGSLDLQETGYDANTDGQLTAIESYYETKDFGLPAGGFPPNQDQGINRFTRIVRIEPDFVMSGNLTLSISGREFPQSQNTVVHVADIDSTTEKVDTRLQLRYYRIKWTSNEVGGFYEQGHCVAHVEPGDIRN